MEFKNILKFVDENKKVYLAKELAENKKHRTKSNSRKTLTVSNSSR